MTLELMPHGNVKGTSSWSKLQHGRSEFTPADDVVERHPAVLADVDCDNFAPEQQALHQHPGEGGHEEEVE